MGGERFEINQPEAYLFGENMDLNFLGGKPTPFPYPAPQACEATRPLRSLINIRKESLRFVKPPEDADERTRKSTTSYNIEFTFDSDVRCAITIYYFCTEEVTAQGYFCKPRDPTMNSETYHYKCGVNQQFVQVSHTFDPSKYTEDDLNCRFEDEIFLPVVVQCVAEEGEEPYQSHTLIAVVEKYSDNTYSLKPLKQKLFVDGLCYLMQEIYGIENKSVNHSKEANEDEIEDNGSECVICMSDSRDTLILPCRHLCLCNSCADSLRYQANNCPICRSPFRALLQIRAVRKAVSGISQLGGGGDNQTTQDVPVGYEPVSLLEALNGPYQSSAPHPPSVIHPPFPLNTHSPDGSTKSRSLDRLQSCSATSLRVPGLSSGSDKEDSGSEPPQLDRPTTPEVVITTTSSPSDKLHLKSDTLPLSRGEARRHKKVPRSSGPEKIRLLTESVQIVNEIGGGKRKMTSGELEGSETRSLLDGGALSRNVSAVGGAVVSGAKPSQSDCRISPLSMSTPHSLHLCDKVENIPAGTDVSPSGDDSDYYTPEDPTTTIFVDQGTDTSLDMNQTEDLPLSVMLSSTKTETDAGARHTAHVPVTRNSSDERVHTIKEDPLKEVECEEKKNPESDEEDRTETTTGNLHVLSSPTRHPLLLQQETNWSLPGTPASNASNRSSGDSFGSNSSTRLLLPQQSCDTLPE
ncbi:E3 ubiquitin-protein ligase MGRN1-like [Limulus polyphemus]|uniref:RING-type E3 ubiquitin transferase n=1 Tax=Limulus polyphemus TaxID=6850 RepID=A0ABM1T8B3_LIMPO|nr:E3 ubiquitin-protein ligase MGRN1-like [Limulus polyphemus]